jgi:hypothetical protein
VIGRETLEVTAWPSDLGKGSAPSKVSDQPEQRFDELRVAFSKQRHRIRVVRAPEFGQGGVTSGIEHSLLHGGGGTEDR